MSPFSIVALRAVVTSRNGEPLLCSKIITLSIVLPSNSTESM